jgi:hypothetical protein
VGGCASRSARPARCGVRLLSPLVLAGKRTPASDLVFHAVRAREGSRRRRRDARATTRAGLLSERQTPDRRHGQPNKVTSASPGGAAVRRARSRSADPVLMEHGDAAHREALKVPLTAETSSGMAADARAFGERPALDSIETLDRTLPSRAARSRWSSTHSGGRSRLYLCAAFRGASGGVSRERRRHRGRLPLVRVEAGGTVRGFRGAGSCPRRSRARGLRGVGRCLSVPAAV